MAGLLPIFDQLHTIASIAQFDLGLRAQCILFTGAAAIFPVSITVALFSAALRLAHSELGLQSIFFMRLMLEGNG